MDLVGAVMLVFKKTRYTALVLQTVFHMMNMMFFDIGTFPFMMIASGVLWLEPATCVKIAQCFKLRNYASKYIPHYV